MNYFKGLLAILLASAVAYSCCVPQKTVEFKFIERPKNIYSSIAKLQVDLLDGSGSSAVATAFAIDKRRLITAGHYCEVISSPQVLLFAGPIQVIILNNNEEQFTISGAKIVAIDHKNDLCLLYLKGHGVVPLEIVKRYRQNVHVGDPIKVVGAPLGYFPVEADGKIVQLNSKGQGVISAPIGPGHSGSPVIDVNMKVVGVAVAAYTVYNKVSIMTPANTLLKFLRDNGVYLR